MWHKTTSSDTSSLCHVGFSSVNHYKLHILSKIACLYLPFNTEQCFDVYHLGNCFFFFFEGNFIKLCAKLHVSLSSRAFQEEHHIEVTYTVCHIFLHQKTFIYLSKTLNYSVCVKGSHENICPAFCT